jgi:HSP20 family molecular chaperone IbpA
VVRKNDSLLLRADVPGIKPEEVKIEVEDDVLTVSGQHVAPSTPGPASRRRGPC